MARPATRRTPAAPPNETGRPAVRDFTGGAVAHVIEMQGRHREGVAWLDGLKGHWGGANDFINHLWWHRTLYHLELEQYAKVLEIYDEHVRTGRLDFYLVMHNAASLLWRLELYGVEVGDRWAELAGFAAERVHDHANPFNDMHFAMALAAFAALALWRVPPWLVVLACAALGAVVL